MQKFQTASLRKVEQQLRNWTGWQTLPPLLIRQRLSLILMLVGIALLGYVGSEYWAMHREQQALHQRWDQQQTISTSNFASAVTNTNNDGLTRVVIPKIDLDLIVEEGTNHKALRLGPGHLKNTPAPGEPGNSVISAHRDTFFRHIYELGKGDQIQVRRDGQTYIFEVTGKKIVDPDDLSVVKNTSDTRLTLITCYPIYYVGPAPQRLIVSAKLVNGTPSKQRAAPVVASSMRQGV